MQPSAPPQRSPYARWILSAIAVAIITFAVLFFVQTRDPMILIFGIIAAFMALAIFRPYRYWGWGYGPMWGYGPAQPPTEIVKVRCAACRALNEENARFCHQCGKPM